MAKVLSFAWLGIVFLVLLFLKLCYSTALFSTLAEITRRIQLFRKLRRPAVRALLLLPAVILFCTAVLFALNLVRLFGGGFSLTPGFFIFLVLRIAFLLAALAVGLLLGLLVAGRIPMGRDRFGGVIYKNRGRYLAFWLGTFSLCGLFRLLPWGFVTYWTIWFLLVGASLALMVHWRLYGRYRSLRLHRSPGLPPGEPLDLSLSAREAVLLSALLRHKGPADAQALARALKSPDPVLLAHPGWAWELGALADEAGALEAGLEGLVLRHLATRTGGGYAPAGQAQRLASLGQADWAAGLTVHEGGAATTRVLHRAGPSSLILEIGPTTLGIREVPPGQDPFSSIATS
jgi:hypothetical protein